MGSIVFALLFAAPGPLAVPGMDFSSMPPAAQRELQNVLSDDFCYCGCPHALGACLRAHPTCKHAKRMTKLAAAQALTGMAATEIINGLSQYYLSFRDPVKTFTVDERQCVGPKDAKVTLTEFSDFECPFCGKARPMLETFIKENAKKARLCWMAFPLPQHPNATPAGQAVLYARDHGKFWQMHDALFENQTKLNLELIKQLGKKVGLTQPDFEKLFGTTRYVSDLDASRNQGRTAGVDSTPTLFLNGHRLSLTLNAETLAQAVDDQMEWEANKAAWAPDEAR